MDSTTPTPQTPLVPSVPLDVTDQQTTALLDDTVALLNDGVPDKETKRGLAEVERWEAVLAASERPGLAKIIQELATLREQIGAPGTQAHEIAETLATLGAETNKVADEASNGYTGPLTQLGKLLIKMSNALSR
ncbi:hypothetical protein [Hymenobacter crusticola]|uniref:Uncharacterized protein n=1 Tax=Hymenobacter crusticola TaxID=1770526 RepID=A0A243WJ40_9BACT|nr:hypothetical protein [Hymenobacter crusticola]OUJ75924.1 hypothetical protein BXP70_01155 [Hymenobacter crusticola]